MKMLKTLAIASLTFLHCPIATAQSAEDPNTRAFFYQESGFVQSAQESLAQFAQSSAVNDLQTVLPSTAAPVSSFSPALATSFVVNDDTFFFVDDSSELVFISDGSTILTANLQETLEATTNTSTIDGVLSTPLPAAILLILSGLGILAMYTGNKSEKSA